MSSTTSNSAPTQQVPINLPGSLPYRPSPTHRECYLYGTGNVGRLFRYDGQYLRCFIGNCAFVKRCVKEFTGRQHFQEWHGISIERTADRVHGQGVGWMGREYATSQARLVTAQQAQQLNASWITFKNAELARLGFTPFDREANPLGAIIDAPNPPSQTTATPTNSSSNTNSNTNANATIAVAVATTAIATTAATTETTEELEQESAEDNNNEQPEAEIN